MLGDRDSLIRYLGETRPTMLDTILRSINVAKAKSPTLMAYIKLCFPYRKKLTEYGNFVRRAKKSVKERQL